MIDETVSQTMLRATDAMAEAITLLARLRLVQDAARDARSFLNDAIEGTGDDEGWLLANDPDNAWVRTICARDKLAFALDEYGEAAA